MSLDCWHTLPGSPINDVRVFVLLAVYNLHSVKDFELLSNDSISPASNIPILFLPLPSHFNYNKWTDWEMLSKQIEKWLIELDMELPQWTWGHNIFWLTFIAAFPSFPRGTWHMWDPCILLEGVISRIPDLSYSWIYGLILRLDL
jgi:hypothetical protein